MSKPSSQRIANASTQRNNNTEIDYTQPLATLDRRHVGEARLGDSDIKHTGRCILVSNIAQKCIEPRIKNACLNSAPIE